MKQSCISIPQDGAQLCGERAIVTARGIHQASDNRNKCRQWTEPRQCVRRRDQAARALLGEVCLRPGPYGPDELTLLAPPQASMIIRYVYFFCLKFFLFLGPSLINGSFSSPDHRGRRQQSLRLF